MCSYHWAYISITKSRTHLPLFQRILDLCVCVSCASPNASRRPNLLLRSWKDIASHTMASVAWNNSGSLETQKVRRPRFLCKGSKMQLSCCCSTLDSFKHSLNMFEQSYCTATSAQEENSNDPTILEIHCAGEFLGCCINFWLMVSSHPILIGQ